MEQGGFLFGNVFILDMLIIVVYFIFLLIVGIRFTKPENNNFDYFLAGGSLGWINIGFSIFAVTISSEHMLVFTGAGAKYGIVVGWFTLMLCLTSLLMAWFFTPRYYQSRVFTVPEFFGTRFSKSSRLFLTSYLLLINLIIKISLSLFAGGLLLQLTLGWDFAISAFLVVFVAGIYSIAGGFRAIAKIDVFQAIVMILGMSVFAIVGLEKVGGLSILQTHVPSHLFSIVKPMNHPEFPWTGLLLGAPVIGIWHWCIDQFTVQRVLGSKSAAHAQKGVILAGFLNILPVFIFVVPGIFAMALVSKTHLPQDAFPSLVASSILPAGVKGMVVISIFAALISTLASCFNSSATLFTRDIFHYLNPDTHERELVLVGRLATTAVVIWSILLIPFIRYIQIEIHSLFFFIYAYITPPVVAVFLVGMLWKRSNSRGVLSALVIGTTIGLAQFVLVILNYMGIVDSSGLAQIAEINLLHFAIMLFVFSAGIMVIISMITESAAIVDLPASISTIPSTDFVGRGLMNIKNNKINIGISTLLIIIIISIVIKFL
ncbi:sodium/solute symporter [candidate division KSB1 bacterium]|nr:sodium/solute symporter [candidate division KSB1 bacterium]